MYHHEDHDCYVTNKIYHFYLHGFATNLSINTKDEGSVDCHKAVLVAMSEYFRLMFDVGSTDVDINVLELNTTCDTMKDVLQFIYKGTTNIHDDNVASLLAQSIDMQLYQLTQLCTDFIGKTLSINNVVQYHECSMSLQHESLSMITSVYIRNNCTQLLSTGNLTKLRIDTLKPLLAYMNTDGVEEQIKLDVILQWLAVHSDCNESAELLSAIQIDELTIDCLEWIKDNPIIKQQHKLLIQESLNMKYEQELEKQCEKTEKHLTYQKEKNEPGMMLKEQDNIGREQEILVGQHQTMENLPTWWFKHQLIKVIVIPVVIAIVISITIIILPTQLQINLQEPVLKEHLVMMNENNQISKYNNNTNNWIELMNVPNWVDFDTSWNASEHRIVIAGAEYDSVNADRVAVLDMKSRGVKELPRLPAARSMSGVVVDGDEVYIIGGVNNLGASTNTMYYTNITRNNGWTTLPTMLTATYGCVISVDSDHIYVFGGFPVDTQTQIYNKHTQQWSRGATMATGCLLDKMSCIKEGNKFTILSNDTMMEYDPNDNTWMIVKQYTAYGGHAAAVLYKCDINVLELNTNSDIVKDVLQFIYKGTTVINFYNVELLLAHSINIELHQLTQQCKDFIEKNLSIDNVVQYHECSMSLQYEPLSMITSVFIKNNCAQLLSTGNLTKLRIDTLKSLLAYMDTDGVEEHIKLDITLQWLTVHSDCNKNAELLSAIHFDKLTIDCLELIKVNPLLEQQHKLLIQESLNMKHRQELEHLVMKTSKQIKQYNVSTKTWIKFMDVPDWVDDSTSCYASEHRIVIAGAHYSSVNADRVAVLDMKSRGVKELPRLPAVRCHPGVVVDGDEVYIIGGRDSPRTVTNTMYYTNITQNNGWTTLRTMSTATCRSVISVDSDHIYVFGGYPDATLTQIYNKHTQQWSRGATMPARCHMDSGRCIKEGNKFTIITKNTMMEYDSIDNKWQVVKKYKPYELFRPSASVSYKGDILSCGIHKENKISRYDADSDDVWVETDIDVCDIEYGFYLFKVCI